MSDASRQREKSEDGDFPNKHGGSRTVYAEIQKHTEDIEERGTQNGADSIGCHIGKRFSLRTKKAAERQRTAERRRAQADIARVDCAGRAAGGCAEQRKRGRGKEQPDDRKNAGNRQRGEKTDGRGAKGTAAVSAAQTAADGAARTHAEREADSLLQSGQREARADGGGKLCVASAQNQRFKQTAKGGSDHGGDARRGDFQRQAAHITRKPCFFFGG